MAELIELMDEGKIKKYFNMKYKYCFPGAVSHITQHATGKEPLFLEEADYLYMLHQMKEITNKFHFNMISFALMLNHVHLLIKFEFCNMVNAMQKLFQSYAIYFNKKYQRKGHVFCGSYRPALCLDENYIIASSLYMHLNPVKRDLVEDPEDYRWSSCALFLRDTNLKSFVDYRFVLNLLDSDISKARIIYKNLLDKFRMMNLGNVSEEPSVLDTIVKVLKNHDKKWLEMHGLMGDTDLEYKILELRRKGALRGPEKRSARKFLIEQLKSRGYCISDIAKKLNLSRQSVYSYLNTLPIT